MKKHGSLLFCMLGMCAMARMCAMASSQGKIYLKNTLNPQMAIFHQSGWKKLDLTPKQKKKRAKSKISRKEQDKDEKESVLT